MPDHSEPFPAATPLQRRQIIRLLGATAAASLVASLDGPSAAAPLPATPPVPACVMHPQQTAGPYFVDENLKRSDIRPDPSDGSVKAGVVLRLRFQVAQLEGRSCTPLPGAIVDLWHCDALGVYSDVRDWSFDTRGQKFLRGYQVTDQSGAAAFTTIYPGWYPGRTVHMHFKIRTGITSRRGYEFTSQLYFDDALTDQIHQRAPYAARQGRRLRNNQDAIFRDGGERLILEPRPSAHGYVGIFDIGLQWG